MSCSQEHTQHSEQLHEHSEDDDNERYVCCDSSGTSICGYDGDDDDNETICDNDCDLYDNDNQLICYDNNKRKAIKEWIFVGSTVLSRWTDGLWYLGLIVQIDAVSSKCLVQFEDSSNYWTRFEDLHKQLSVGTVMADSDILCTTCGDGISVSPNEIVICDVCNQGYHQNCHKPKIGDEILEPDMPWSCRLCVFALGTKEGGALNNGIIGDALRRVKTVFPYDLNALHWDESHYFNKESLYCYCGGPGNYYSKMLQCERCLQWFHEACIQALETPLLYGDHYYTFLCAICNKGKECVKRIIMKWSDVMALVINNLALQHQKRFFDLHSEIVTFVQNNYHMLKLSEDISKLSEDELTVRITAVLENNKSRFICGKELRKKVTQWALRLPFPFTTPLIFAPPFSLHSPSSNVISPSSSPPFSSSALLRSPTSSNANSSTPLIFGACRKGATKWPSAKRSVKKLATRIQGNGRSNSCSSSTGSNSCAASSFSSISRFSRNNLKYVSKSTNSSKIVSEAKKSTKRVSKYPPSIVNSDSSDIEISSTCTIESLEAVIPRPQNFDGDNNPFNNANHTSRVLQNCLQIATNRRASTDKNENSLIGQLNNKFESTQHRISVFKSDSCNPSDTSFDQSNSSTINCSSHSVNDQLLGLGHNEKFNILAQRVRPNGTVEYLLEWDNN